MKKSAIWMFILGTLLELVGLFLAYPERFPFVVKIISPKYNRVLSSLQFLEHNRELFPDHPGFQALSDLILESRVHGQPSGNMSGVQITKVTRTKNLGRLVLTPTGRSYEIPLKVFLSNGYQVDENLAKLRKLRKKAEDLKQANFFGVTSLLFCLGVLLQFSALIVQAKESETS